MKVEEMFNHYLKLSKVDLLKISPIQLNEMKKAFFAGVGSLIAGIMDCNETEESILSFMDATKEETLNFWKEQK